MILTWNYLLPATLSFCPVTTMQIVVTGGAGFIASNIIKCLNNRRPSDLVTVVDDLTDGTKFRNLVDCRIVDYVDATAFREAVRQDNLDKPDLIVHQGAVTATNEPDGRYAIDVNYTFSKELLAYCRRNHVRIIYASSAAVYDGQKLSLGTSRHLQPRTVYGYSKLLFDQFVASSSTLPAQVVGLRYFNVYGPHEFHKHGMASIVLQGFDQVQHGDGIIRLFGASHGFEAGLQERDFVHVDDVVETVMWMVEHEDITGIYDVGTGKARTFIDVANSVTRSLGKGSVSWRVFPTELQNSYQAYTCADLSPLRTVKFDHSFMDIETGIQRYVNWLLNEDPYRS